MSEQKYEEVFEEGGAKEARTVHRMRANSTIMKVQKILGESPAHQRGITTESVARHYLFRRRRLADLMSFLQSPTEEKSVS